MGGVIQIYTKDYNGYSLETALGSSGQLKKLLMLDLKERILTYQLMQHDDRHEGFSDRDDTGQKDNFQNKSQSAKLNITHQRLPIKLWVSVQEVNITLDLTQMNLITQPKFW